LQAIQRAEKALQTDQVDGGQDEVHSRLGQGEGAHEEIVVDLGCTAVAAKPGEENGAFE
jgi:hypothetical protein